MAGKYGSASVGYLVDGVNMLAAKFKSLSLKFSNMTEQADGIGDAYEIFLPTGKAQTILTQGGALFDTATGSLHALMAAGTPTTPQATPRIGVIWPMGSSVGALFYGLAALFTNEYEPVLEGSKLTKANVSTLMAGQSERGQIVQPLATKTADWNTKSLGTVVDFALDVSQYSIPITSASKAATCVVTTTVPHGRATGDIVFISGNSLAGPAINGEQTITVTGLSTFTVAVDTSGSTGAGTGGKFVRANSTGGGAGYQQATALTGFTNYVGKLRDSADDSTYADLLSFADITNIATKTLAAQRVAVAGVIDRYVCHDGNVTGTGSITVMSGLIRL